MKILNSKAILYLIGLSLLFFIAVGLSIGFRPPSIHKLLAPRRFTQTDKVTFKDYKLQETLWADSKGNKLSRYEEAALTRNPTVLIYEKQLQDKRLWLYLDDATYFSKVVGDSLYLYDKDHYRDSGWFKLVRYKTGLIDSIFSFEPLGVITRVEKPQDFNDTESVGLYGGVFKYYEGKLVKVGDNAKVRDLFDDVNGDGIFYVSEPGLGLDCLIDLTRVGE